jgi:hypothetical protein
MHSLARSIPMLLLAVAATGCVQRRMTIRSDPPGALVYVDDYQIGTTPVSHDFVSRSRSRGTNTSRSTS